MPKGRHGHGRGLIQLYILHSLKTEPKSGYDIIKEISERTDRVWVPSKGTMYPMLKKMEEDNLITISETGKRSKTIYEITDEGTVFLEGIIRHRKEAEEKMYVLSDIMTEIFGKKYPSLRKRLIEMWHIADKIPPEKENEAGIAIEKCLNDLKQISEGSL